MKVIIIISWIISLLGAGLGGIVLVGGLYSAQGAPQEAVVCALACACGILPYCFARAVTEIVKSIQE
jgi:hypothetical protein